MKASGSEDAEQFLQFNRTVRHQANENIRFVFTGSIGLHTIAEKLKATVQINDLNTIEIPPLNREEANEFTKQLLDSAEISYKEDAITSLLNKIEWFVPFHIQLVVQELIDIYEDTNETVNKSIVENAFDKIFDMRYKIYFEHYYSRLETTFDGNEYPFALDVLQELSQKDDLNMASVREMAEKHELANYRMVLETLEFDGYIFRLENDETFYHFTSPVLRLWWRKYVC
ncbi:hypothetical protein QUF72_12330 [Desulfobacterales bacterium HSG2]|nr:hypothetical protein [Desulfobacterales bacterium HSG2]